MKFRLSGSTRLELQKDFPMGEITAWYLKLLAGMEDRRMRKKQQGRVSDQSMIAG